MDPPYYDNVMYAELSDFFYVWLKRTAGRVFPELFRRQLTDKDNEAVANPAKFEGQKGAKALAGARLPAADGRHFRRVPPRAEARRHHDADVHAQGHRRLGRAGHGTDGGRVHDHRLVADQHRGRGQPAYQGQVGRQQHDLPGLPPAPASAADAETCLLGGRRAARRRGGARSASRSSRRRASAAWICTSRASARRWRSSRSTGRCSAARHASFRAREAQGARSRSSASDSIPMPSRRKTRSTPRGAR